jgi:hypothetical protein
MEVTTGKIKLSQILDASRMGVLKDLNAIRPRAWLNFQAGYIVVFLEDNQVQSTITLT